MARHSSEKAVKDALKDPDSARFGEFYQSSKSGNVCLVVNAKNSMGGYTGDQIAKLSKDSSGYHVEDISEGSFEGCKIGFGHN